MHLTAKVSPTTLSQLHHNKFIVASNFPYNIGDKISFELDLDAFRLEDFLEVSFLGDVMYEVVAINHFMCELTELVLKRVVKNHRVTIGDQKARQIALKRKITFLEIEDTFNLGDTIDFIVLDGRFKAEVQSHKYVIQYIRTINGRLELYF